MYFLLSKFYLFHLTLFVGVVVCDFKSIHKIYDKMKKNLSHLSIYFYKKKKDYILTNWSTGKVNVSIEILNYFYIFTYFSFIYFN